MALEYKDKWAEIIILNILLKLHEYPQNLVASVCQGG